MTEIFTNESCQAVMTLPQNGSVDINAQSLDWTHSGTDGFWIKPLLEDHQQGLRTWLMKVDAGASSVSHAHDDIEQIYVIEGSFHDQDKTYGAGDLIVRAPGAMHTAGSEDGAIVLLVYSPINSA